MRILFKADMIEHSFKEYKLKELKKSGFAEEYLEIAIQDYIINKDIKPLLLALKDVAEARGGMAKLAENTKRSRTSLYKTLSAKGNPTLDTFGSILHELGLRIRIESIKPLKSGVK